ncbi:MAG: type II toxin-antitoxin system RelE/ParE family toxin [Syntrophales bacterium]|jgi:plasmid stabilization system protein ParE|nr:type II toxin-antitoxin system RelE/ParE family toxin [Syntrophales bacterium]
MKVRFLELARFELDDAFAWYEEQMPGLGRELLQEVDRSIHRATRWPLSGKVIASELRRCLVKRFPYGIIYGIEEDTLVVVSIAHLHRRPYYWIERWEKAAKGE